MTVHRLVKLLLQIQEIACRQLSVGKQSPESTRAITASSAMKPACTATLVPNG